MLNRLDLRGATDLAAALAASGADDDVTATVRVIIDDVRARGDAALRDLTERFDGCRIDDLRVPQAVLDDALARAEPAFRAALAYAAAEIRAYHELQVQPAPRRERDGIELAEITRPVDRAGLYVPGGRATYPSTVLMTAIPAQVAGVPEIVLCVPPGPDGRVPDAHARRRRAGRRRRGVPGRRRPGDRRAGLRHREHPAGRRDRRARERVRRRRQARGRGRRSASTRSPGPRRSWSWPTAARPPSSSPPTSWPRPSTARAAPRCSSPGTPTSPTRSTPRSVELVVGDGGRQADIEATLRLGGRTILVERPGAGDGRGRTSSRPSTSS